MSCHQLYIYCIHIQGLTPLMKVILGRLNLVCSEAPNWHDYETAEWKGGNFRLIFSSWQSKDCYSSCGESRSGGGSNVMTCLVKFRVIIWHSENMKDERLCLSRVCGILSLSLCSSVKWLVLLWSFSIMNGCIRTSNQLLSRKKPYLYYIYCHVLIIFDEADVTKHN